MKEKTLDQKIDAITGAFVASIYIQRMMRENEHDLAKVRERKKEINALLKKYKPVKK